MDKGIADEVASVLADSNAQLEDGIFNLVITLTRQKMATMSAEEAKTETAEFLGRLIEGLTYEEINPINIEKDT